MNCSVHQGASVGCPGRVASCPGQVRLPRVAAQRAFWFGWYAQFPETELIK